MTTIITALAVPTFAVLATISLGTIRVPTPAQGCVPPAGRELTVNNPSACQVAVKNTATARSPTNAYASMAGKGDTATSASGIPDVCMEHVKNNGNVTARKAGEGCSAIKTSTIAPTISLVRTEAPASIRGKDLTLAVALLDIPAPIVKTS